MSLHIDSVPRTVCTCNGSQHSVYWVISGNGGISFTFDIKKKHLVHSYLGCKILHRSCFLSTTNDDVYTAKNFIVFGLQVDLQVDDEMKKNASFTTSFGEHYFLTGSTGVESMCGKTGDCRLPQLSMWVAVYLLFAATCGHLVNLPTSKNTKTADPKHSKNPDVGLPIFRYA